MGYSIAVPLKSPKARDRMYAFLGVHWCPWTDLQPSLEVIKPYEEIHLINWVGDGLDWTKYICLDGEMSYDEGKCRIGFNYSCSSSPVTDYAWSLLRWIALREGRKRAFPKLLPRMPSSDGSLTKWRSPMVPYVVYDGFEACPVLEREQWDDVALRHYIVDKVGCRPLSDRSAFENCVDRNKRLANGNIPKNIDLLIERMKKLSPLWDIWESIIHGEMKRLDGLYDEWLANE